MVTIPLYKYISSRLPDTHPTHNVASPTYYSRRVIECYCCCGCCSADAISPFIDRGMYTTSNVELGLLSSSSCKDVFYRIHPWWLFPPISWFCLIHWKLAFVLLLIIIWKKDILGWIKYVKGEPFKLGKQEEYEAELGNNPQREGGT